VTKPEYIALMQTKMNDSKAAREAKEGKEATSGYTLGQVEDALAGFTGASLEVMAGAESIALPGFGKFSTAHRKERSGKVPGTDRTYVSPAKYVPRFAFTEAVVKSIAEANSSRI